MPFCGRVRIAAARSRPSRPGTRVSPSAPGAAALALCGTALARARAAVEQLGAVPVHYRHGDFLARVRSLPRKGVDVVLDGLGGAISVRSFRALGPGGRLVVFGYSSALTQG